MIPLYLVSLAIGYSILLDEVENSSLNKPFVTEIKFNSSFRAFLQDLRYQNEGLPLRCRNDVCKEEKTKDRRKGIFSWGLSLAGQRYHFPCPYGPALDNATNQTQGVRDCIFEGNETAWTYPNYQGCADPPTVLKLKSMVNELQRRKQINGDTEFLKLTQKAVEDVLQLYKNYTDVPVLPEDIKYGGLILESYMKIHKKLNISVSVEIMKNILHVADRILNASLASVLGSGDAKVRVIRALILFTELIEMEKASHFNVSTNHTFVEIRKFTPDGTLRMGDGTTTELDFNVPANIKGQLQTNLLILYGIQNYFNNVVLKKILDAQKSPTNSTFASLPRNFSSDLVTSAYKSKKQSTLRRPGITWWRGRADITYVHIKSVVNKGTVFIPLTINMSRFLQPNSKRGARYACGKLKNPLLQIAEGQRAHWSSCTQSFSDGYMHCRCQNTTMQGIFSSFIRAEVRVHGREDKLSSFLRFPYSEDIYYIGKAMRILSLICLILTVLSYGVFRETRAGRPTLILLHLCVSLIILLTVVSLLDHFVENTHACRIANGLMLYLVLVSLMWNGTEAVNMYLLLVKVLNAHISHFMVKAGVLCWGIPALIGFVTLLIDNTAFDGEYVNCKCRCKLAKRTLYFAFLLPMGTIIIHNVVIFVMVMRCLVQGRAVVSPGQKRCKMVQLLGAVTLLVLLGVPWVFSSFGAIDAAPGENLALLEGIFHVIFVVFVNIQGVFIFIFHCVRVRDIRISWSNAFSSGPWTSSSACGKVFTGRSQKVDKSSNETLKLAALKPVSNLPSSETQIH